MARPLCLVYIATSVDGFIARTDGTLDWLDAVQRRGEDYGFARFFRRVDTLVIGRKTYDFVRALKDWPYGDKRCTVFTHRPVKPKAGETFFSGTPRALLARLAKQGAQRIYVDGGNVISQFLAAGLIDELTVSQIPVLLGDGVRLFQDGQERGLRLVRTRSFPTGLVQSTWRVAHAGARA
ncbi:MAG: dihydrofolate reductase family protein [Myxococcota bacterium]